MSIPVIFSLLLTLAACGGPANTPVPGAWAELNLRTGPAEVASHTATDLELHYSKETGVSREALIGRFLSGLEKEGWTFGEPRPIPRTLVFDGTRDSEKLRIMFVNIGKGRSEVHLEWNR